MKYFYILFLLILVSCGQSQFGLSPQSLEMAYQPKFNSKVDVLFVIDNSSSMDVHQQFLAESAGDLVNELIKKGMDFKIAATTTDMANQGERGLFIGSPKYIDRNTPNIANALKEKILRGTQGSSVEKGLDAIKSALSSPLIEDENKDFLRLDALLVIIVLSNENDYSDSPVALYQNFLDDLKPGTLTRSKNWLMNFVGVTGQPGENCKTFGDYKDVGLRYLDLVEHTKGTSASICTVNLKTAVRNIQRILLTLLTEILLDRVPIEDTIVVKFNGENVPKSEENGWSYDYSKNAILFHGSYIPQTNTDIAINYDPVTAK